LLKPEKATEREGEPDAGAVAPLEPEWERQKRRLRRRELIVTIIGAAMLLMGMAISLFRSLGR